MLNLVLSDLRHSWRVWIGAFVLLAVVATMIAWMAALAAVGFSNIDLGSMDLDMKKMAATGVAPPSLIAAGLASAMTTTGLFLLIVVTITVAGVGALVIDQRRRILALWQLGGIGDGQLATVLLAQMAILAIAASLVGLAVGASSARAVAAYVADNGLIVPQMSLHAMPIGLIVGGFIAVGVSLFGMLAAIWRVRRIRAIEALHPVDGQDARMTVLRWLGFAAAMALALLCAIGTATSDARSSDNVALLLMLMLCVAMHLGGPALIPRWVAAWTRRVPNAHAPTWWLARCALAASSARLVGSVVPVAIGVVLVVGLMSLESSRAAAGLAAGGRTSPFSLIAVIGLPLTVSMVGAAVMVFMTSQQRDREIALGALAGATPGQQLLQAVFESAIVVVSGVVLGLIGVAMALACYQPGLMAAHGRGGFVIALDALAWVTLLAAAANLTACVVPAFIAQRRAPTRLLAAD